MSDPRRTLSVCAALLGLLASADQFVKAEELHSPAAPPQVWLSPAFSFSGHQGSVDNLELFKDSAPWAEARARVNVFKVAVHTINQMSDEDLANIFSYLNKAHIAFAVEYGMLSASDACGRGVEGFKPDKMPVHLSNRIKKLGGRIRYIAMDEPLHFGHYYGGHNSCRWTIDFVAHDAAQNIRQFRDQFPDVEIGDIEPVNGIKSENWIEDVRYWIEAYRRETGTPLAFFHDDMVWREPIAERTRMLISLLDSRGIKFGVIFNSRGDVNSDQEWIDSAKRNMEEYRASSLRAPDQIIIQSWKPYPTHVLPESSPFALTHLVNYYFVGH